ncbi:MAG TPA: SDR family oxidoreductase [Gemmatimonadales bacterium]
MILVIGATGALGSEICRLLVERGRPVRALVRPSSDPARVQRLRDLGIGTTVGDLKDPDTLVPACEGAAVVISTASTTGSHQPDDSIPLVDRDGQIAAVDAAREAGVGQFVYISYSGNIDVDSPLHSAKREVEQHLRASGMEYTILRPSVFMEVWLSPALGFDVAQGAARIFGPGDRPVSWISAADVARFAVDCVGAPAAMRQVIELGGPEALTPLEVVSTFEALGGRPIAREHVSEETLDRQWRQAIHPLEKSFAALMLGISRGDPIDMTATLQTFPRRLTSVREYAERVMKG